MAPVSLSNKLTLYSSMIALEVGLISMVTTIMQMVNLKRLHPTQNIQILINLDQKMTTQITQKMNIKSNLESQKIIKVMKKM